MKTIIITRASGSIGAVATRTMAAEGWHVVMACRNEQKAEAIRQSILADLPTASIEIRRLEMSSLADVRRFVAEWGDRPVDALFNNAGVIARDYSLSPDGYERTMAVNYLAPILLTRLLVPLMPAGGNIVNMVSLTVRFGRIALDWPSWGAERFSQLGTYSTSKQALLLHTVALAQKYPHLHVNVSDPGVVDSNMISMGRWFDPLADLFFRPFISTPEKGARSALLALRATDSLGYYVGSKRRNIAKRYLQSPLIEKLWAQSEELMNL